MDIDRLKATVKNDVRHCIIHEGRDPEECLDDAIAKYDINGKNEEKIRTALGDNR